MFAHRLGDPDLLHQPVANRSEIRRGIDSSLSVVNRYTPSVAIVCEGRGVYLTSLRPLTQILISPFKSV